jgi:hypothetical protein
MRILKNGFATLCLAAMANVDAFAQQKTTITGNVVDAGSAQPIPYATVIAVNNETAKTLVGATTDFDGQFTLASPTPSVFLVVSFIGFRSDTITQFTAAEVGLDAGVIRLHANHEQLDEVEVTREASRTRFELDKRVFTVGTDLSTTGASALDVLNHVPSVSVNIEGEVSLRGSSGVQILIDGKPSILADGQGNALGTITADMIESVEVITNPSAKYDAAGTAGILNIVLKKEEQKGLNGSVSLNTGSPDNHSVGFSLNRRTNKFNLFTQMGLGYRSLPRFAEAVNTDRNSGTTIASEGSSYRNENFYNITLGTDYHIDARNVLTLSGNFAYEVESNPSSTAFSSFTGTDATHIRMGPRGGDRGHQPEMAIRPAIQAGIQGQQEAHPADERAGFLLRQGPILPVHHQHPAGYNGEQRPTHSHQIQPRRPNAEAGLHRPTFG